MTTRSEALARRDSAPIVILTVDALGEHAGIWRFCTRRPDYRPADPLYKPWLAAWPSILKEDTNPLGGVAKSGELSFEVVDVDDELTGLLRTDAQPVTELSGAVSAGSTTLGVGSSSPFTAGESLAFVGPEAMTVTALVAGPGLTVTRGALGTEALAHAAGEAVYLYSPTLYGRRVRMYVAFGEPGYSQAEELAGEVGGGWSIDTIGLSRGLCNWTFAARSQLRFLDRLLYRRTFRGFLEGVEPDVQYLRLRDVSARARPRKFEFGFQFVDRFFMQVGDEVLRLTPETVYLGRLRVDARGVAGTRPGDLEIGDEVRQVYVADPTGGWGSFRYQDPSAETSSLATGTWTADSHPVVLLLCLATSSSDINDDVPTNYSSGTGNFSCLPGGVGLGWPNAEIDFDSFFGVWQRTQGYALDHFVLDRSETGRQVIDRICRIAGYDLHVSAGALRLDFFRSPLEGEGVTTWDDDVILTEMDDEGLERPLIECELDTTLTAGSVVFRTRTSAGVEVESVFTDADFPTLFGNARGYYEAEDQRIEIEAPYVRADLEGAEPEVLRQRALQLLYRFRRPLWRVLVTTDLAQSDVAVGSLVQLTHAQMPDLGTGTRGVVNLVGKITSKEVKVSPEMVGVQWELIMSTAEGRIGRVSPSAAIDSVSGNTATVVTNRYTDPASRNGLPTTDAAAFQVDDVVRLTGLDGAPLATTPATQVVVSISGDDIELDGDFGSTMASGQVLQFANRDDQVAQQHTRFVAMADASTLTVGASSDEAWVFGEP